MTKEVRKETNLEHYKGELKEILLDDYDNPREVFRKISKRFDRQIKISPIEHPTDAILNWMAQPYEESVLDDVEKAYLKAVIKPFKDKVLHIYKTDQYDENYQYIIIVMKSIKYGLNEENIAFPLFKKNAMYKGMKVDKNYTLKELGL
nr:MAG TPA: hypothetical protein [Caudoviricetes sp.]